MDWYNIFCSTTILGYKILVSFGLLLKTKVQCTVLKCIFSIISHTLLRNDSLNFFYICVMKKGVIELFKPAKSHFSDRTS